MKKDNVKIFPLCAARSSFPEECKDEAYFEQLHDIMSKIEQLSTLSGNTRDGIMMDLMYIHVAKEISAKMNE